MKRFFLFVAAMVMTMVAWAAVPKGAQPGKFTINNAGDRVYLASGDLIYQPSTGVWRFAEFDEKREIQNTTGSRYKTDKWLDHFGWGTSGYVANSRGKLPYDIVDKDGMSSLPAGSYGPVSGNLIDQNNYDWAWYNKIENGGNQEHLWSSLTSAEWFYILAQRPNAQKLRFFVRQAGSQEVGLVLLPDNWSATDLFNWDYYFDNPALAKQLGYAYSTEDYISMSYSRIKALHEAGAVILSVGGARYRYEMKWQYASAYWTATPQEDIIGGNVRGNVAAYCLFFAGKIPEGEECRAIGYRCGNPNTDLNDMSTTPIGEVTRGTVHLSPAPLYYGMKVRAAYRISGEEKNKVTLSLSTSGNGYLLLNGEQTLGGDYEFDKGTQVSIEAVPGNQMTRFSHWSTTSTFNPITPTLNDDMSFRAIFEQIPSYTVNTLTNDPAAGTVSGGGYYMEGTEIKLKATANNGYVFLMWADDAEAEAERTITVNSNKTYVAIFGKSTYSVTLRSADPSLGSVDGGGKNLNTGSSVNIKATPQEGCEFLYWQTEDGTHYYGANRSWTVSKDETLTAYFRVKPDYAEYNLYVCGERVTSQNATDILGDGVYSYDADSHTLTVNAETTGSSGSTFTLENKQWINDLRILDGVNKPLKVMLYRSLDIKATTNDNTSRALISGANGIELTSDGSQMFYLYIQATDTYIASAAHLSFSGALIFEATFKGYSDKFKSAILLSNNNSYISVDGASVEINAKGNYGGKNYPVVNIDVSANTLQLKRASVVEGSLSSTKIRISDDTPRYWVTYTSNATADVLKLCPIKGFNIYHEGSVVTITATPVTGYKFVRWSDGNTDNPRTITMDKDYYIDPIVRPEGIEQPGAFINAMADDPVMGSIANFTPGWYNAGTQVTITAQANDGYEFYMWEDGSTTNPYVFTVEEDKSVYKIAIFSEKGAIEISEEQGEELFWVAARADDAEHGSVSGIENGEGWFAAGTQLTLTATPATGWEFVEWSDGDKSNPRVVSVDADALYEAVFAKQTFEVIFYDYNGTVLSTQTVNYGEAAVAPELPEREGYYFSGWDTDFSYVTSDIIVTAQYSLEIVYYTVTFIGFDAVVLKTEQVQAGHSATAPEAPEVEHYTFTGWDQDFSSVSSDLAVIAIYEIDKFIVTFYGMGGLWLKDEQVPYGGSATAPEAPEIEDFVFVGWDADYTNVTSDLIVNAIYESTAVTHKLTLSVEGKGKLFFGIYNTLGELQEAEATEPSYDLTEGAQFLLIAKADNGWKFDGWSDGETKEQRAITMSVDITLTAKFVEISDGVEAFSTQPSALSPRKVLRNGRIIIILPDGKEFDTTGAEVR